MVSSDATESVTSAVQFMVQSIVLPSRISETDQLEQ